jgi:hypothetical protein
MPAKKAFPLRISEDIWQAVRRWSDDELRSVNAQIEYVLRDALRKAGRLPQSADQNKDTPPVGAIGKAGRDDVSET